MVNAFARRKQGAVLEASVALRAMAAVEQLIVGVVGRALFVIRIGGSAF